MPRKSKGRYYNKLSDFYIDSRVGFRGRKDVDDVMNSLNMFFLKISKFRPRRFNIGDVVRVKKSPDHGWLRDKPELWGKPATIKKLHARSLGDMDYEGFEIQIGGKGNWIYVGSDNVTKANRASGRTLKLISGYFKAKPIGNDLYKLEVKYRGGFKKKAGTYRLGTIENGVYTFIPSIVRTPVYGGSGSI